MGGGPYFKACGGTESQNPPDRHSIKPHSVCFSIKWFYCAPPRSKYTCQERGVWLRTWERGFKKGFMGHCLHNALCPTPFQTPRKPGGNILVRHSLMRQTKQALRWFNSYLKVSDQGGKSLNSWPSAILITKAPGHLCTNSISYSLSHLQTLFCLLGKDNQQKGQSLASSILFLKMGCHA